MSWIDSLIEKGTLPMGFFRPGTIRAFSRGTRRQRGRSIRMTSRIWAIIIVMLALLWVLISEWLGSAS